MRLFPLALFCLSNYSKLQKSERRKEHIRISFSRTCRAGSMCGTECGVWVNSGTRDEGSLKKWEFMW